MLPTRLILIGYRGTGKTSVGRPLAETLQYECIDADLEIERLAGASIAEIFQHEGEVGFRERESAVVKELAKREQVVLALGGGAILREENRQALAGEGSLVIWLQASAQTLYERINADATTTDRRPNLTSSGGLQEVVTLLEQREPLYRAVADLSIDTEGKSINEVVALILGKMQ